MGLHNLQVAKQERDSVILLGDKIRVNRYSKEACLELK